MESASSWTFFPAHSLEFFFVKFCKAHACYLRFLLPKESVQQVFFDCPLYGFVYSFLFAHARLAAFLYPVNIPYIIIQRFALFLKRTNAFWVHVDYIRRPLEVVRFVFAHECIGKFQAPLAPLVFAPIYYIITRSQNLTGILQKKCGGSVATCPRG